jgi:hypothetical protein
LWAFSFIVGESYDCGKHTKPDDGKMQAILDQCEVKPPDYGRAR